MKYTGAEEMISISKWVRTAAIIWILVGAAYFASASSDKRLAFRPAEEKGYFIFNTGTLRGTLRLDGKRQGISELIHISTGEEITYGQEHVGILSPYRVMSSSNRYSKAARDWPSEPRLLPDGSVSVRFPRADDHPFEMTAIFTWSAADTLDLETIVTPEKDMPKFEVFLSSYFAAGFDISIYLKANRLEQLEKPHFVSIDHHPLVDGNYLMFPRDRESVVTIFDGRWDIPPNPVQWCINRWMEVPLALRRNRESGVTALVMSPPEDCFAVSTPYNQIPPDRVAAHQSIYLSLFGQDVTAGQTVRARSRLVVGEKLTNEIAIRRYQDYLNTIR
jgi:hypothetical protein